MSPGKQDYYRLLGVKRDATQEVIKRAYFRLAKTYHPDRHFDPTMTDMKTKLEALFDRIHKAYTLLSDQAKRAEYDLAARKAQPQAGEFVEKKAEVYVENYAEKTERAVEQFNNGMRDFKTGNYWGALEAFTWAARLDPLKAPYFYYQGICLMNIPRRRHEAEESLQKALELDHTTIEYHIELSNLYLKSGIKSKAIGVLNDALKHHPGSPRITDAIAAAGEGKLSAVTEVKSAGKPGPQQKVSRDRAERAAEQAPPLPGSSTSRPGKF